MSHCRMCPDRYDNARHNFAGMMVWVLVLLEATLVIAVVMS